MVPSINDMPQVWIDTDPRGGPVRLIINGRHRKPTGLWISVKSRRSMPWESKGERDHFILCEADPSVVSFLAQPHRLTMRDADHVKRVYYPDLRVDHVGGRVEIIEVKEDAEIGDGPRKVDHDYARKLDMAAAVYARLGWDFSEVRGRELRTRRAFLNARDICLDATVTVPIPTILEVLHLFGARATPPLGHVVEALGGGRLGRARLHALIVRRVLALDLDVRIDQASPVRLAREGNFPAGASRC